MIEIRTTDEFKKWFAGLKDRQAQYRIDTRIRRVSLGNPGDVKSLGSGLSEMRISYGPGYRIYFTRKGDTVIILLAGGDKSTQVKDIDRAMAMVDGV